MAAAPAPGGSEFFFLWQQQLKRGREPGSTAQQGLREGCRGTGEVQEQKGRVNEWDGRVSNIWSCLVNNRPVPSLAGSRD